MVKTLTDPNAPKKPLSGYFMWMASGVRDKLLSESKGKKASEVIKTCGDRWKKMPAKEKKFWQDKSSREREVWNKKMAKYTKTSSFRSFQAKKQEADYLKVKTAKKPKDTNANRPKKPLTAFFRFVNYFRKNHSDMKVTEVTKAAGAKWKVLGQAEKIKYMAAAAADQKKYQRDIIKYQKSAEYKRYQEKVKAFNTARQEKLRRLSRKRKRR